MRKEARAVNENTEITRRPKTEVVRDDERRRVPAVDIYETNDTLVLLADMPGVDDGGVAVSVEEGRLSISGKTKTGEGDSKPIYREFDVADFERVFTLSDDLNGAGISGKIQNGVLRLTIPKAEQAKVKKIAVKVE